eukprot:1139059-Pelagomonas_calceolata.AAC.6
MQRAEGRYGEGQTLLARPEHILHQGLTAVDSRCDGMYRMQRQSFVHNKYSLGLSKKSGDHLFCEWEGE